MRDRWDVYVGNGSRKYPWGCVRCVDGGIKDAIGIVEERVKGTLKVVTPGFGITAVAATTRLLCDEEADVVILVRAGTKAATAKNTAFVKRTVSGRRG